MQFLKKILAILQKKEQQKLLKLTILDVIVSVLDIFFLVILLLIIDSYTNPAKILNHSFISFGLWARQPILLIGIICLLFAIKNWFAFTVSQKQYHFFYDVATRISKNQLANYLDSPYSNFASIDSSIQIRAINHDPVDFSQYVLRQVQQIISQSILIILALIPILLFKPVLFSLLLSILLPPLFLLSLLMKKRLQSIQAAAKINHGKLIQYLKEALTGFVESNVYRKKDFFQKRFGDRQAFQLRGSAEQQVVQSIPPRLIEVFAVLGLFVLIIINFYTQGKTIEFITIGAFMAAAYKVIPGIVKISNSIGQIKTYSFTVKNLLPDQASIKNIQPNKESIQTIEFRNVSFSYEKEKILDNVSFRVDAGSLVAICGGSGRGKTTILNLLLGFLSPSSGSIVINNIQQASAGLEAHFDKIAYAKQQPFFIHDTIARNITLQEEYEKTKLNDTVNVAGIDQILEKHEEGLDTMITENGKSLSGGQRQRIAFARAIYKDFDVLLLDEPFSEMDSVSEQTLLEYLQKLAGTGKIILLVTHNRDSLSFCNKIIDLDAD